MEKLARLAMPAKEEQDGIGTRIPTEGKDHGPPIRRRRAQSAEFEQKESSSDERDLDDLSDDESGEDEDYDSEEGDTIHSPKKNSASQNKAKQAVPKLTLGKIKVGIMDSYKSRSARPAFYNQQLLATESADMTAKQGHILLHKNLQLKFLGEENEELRNKVQNLENMVKVNKEIMSTMLTQDTVVTGDASASTSLETQLSNQFKRQVELLEQRNQKLEADMDESNAQRLVLAQIIQDMKNQEDAQQSTIQETMQALQTDLDRKEYILQQSELKVYHYEKYLQRKGLLDSEARQLLNKFQLEGESKSSLQTVSNVVSDNLALKDQLKDTIKDLNRLERQNQKAKNQITELKAKIDKMKKRHTEQMKQASLGPAITASDRKMQVSKMGGGAVDRDEFDGPESSFFQEDLPSLRYSVVDANGQAVGGHGHKLSRVDWNDLLVRDSIPEDYGTIRPSDTQREHTEELKKQNHEIVKNFN